MSSRRENSIIVAENAITPQLIEGTWQKSLATSVFGLLHTILEISPDSFQEHAPIDMLSTSDLDPRPLGEPQEFPQIGGVRIPRLYVGYGSEPYVSVSLQDDEHFRADGLESVGIGNAPGLGLKWIINGYSSKELDVVPPANAIEQLVVLIDQTTSALNSLRS